VARVRVTEQSLFWESEGVPAIVAIEYMAQTIAAFSGARRRDRGLPAQLGLLVGCRLMTLEVEHFRSGDELLVEARHVGSSATLGQFDCAVSCAGTVVARGVLSVYEGPLDRAPP
jgi:predicted hotdog family 3-hydroxylacyl-ACP dehydratase